MKLVLFLACSVGVGAAAADAAQRYGSFPLVPDGLMPRYLVDRSIPLEKRDGTCGDGRHPCLDIGYAGQCCDNEDYCYISNENKPKCCPIGSNCPNDSRCSSDDFFCTRTVTAKGTATAEEGCCNRKCPQTSQYLCPSDLGGKCCPFGLECHAGGNCVTTESPSKTALLTPVVSGCTTSQFKCDDGDGCCNNGLKCTQVSGTAFCAMGTPTESGAKFVDENDLHSGLSAGAKAGIAIGVVVGVGLIVGLAAWLCISKRRRRRQTATQQSGSDPAEDANMTEVTASSRPREPGRGLTRDYFGPDAVAGPYTETVVSSPGHGSAVPPQPQEPGDIAAPVEIGSKDVPLTPSEAADIHFQPESHTIDGRFELYGTEVSPPLHSPSVLSSPTSPDVREHVPSVHEKPTSID